MTQREQAIEQTAKAIFTYEQMHGNLGANCSYISYLELARKLLALEWPCEKCGGEGKLSLAPPGKNEHQFGLIDCSGRKGTGRSDIPLWAILIEAAVKAERERILGKVKKGGFITIGRAPLRLKLWSMHFHEWESLKREGK